ncbi:hypothetical protein [Thiomicrospira sp.]|uniref:hypothetical protein n=1 Tax=Thiomicrospira sp. TaxID=935 RepID=UPI002F942592
MKKLMLIGLLFSALTLGGCVTTGMDPAQSRLSDYQNASDSKLTSGLYSVSADGKEYGLTQSLKSEGYQFVSFDMERLVMRKPVKSNLMPLQIANFANTYQSGAENDALAVEYINIAKSRGNNVGIYRTGVLRGLIGVYGFSHLEKDNMESLGIAEVVLMEQTVDGRPVSILMRDLVSIHTVGADVWQYSTLLMGRRGMGEFENRTKKSVFDENLIKLIK